MCMKKLMSRIISVVLIIALLPVSVLAEYTADPKVVTQPDFTITVSHINPEYARLGVKFTKPSADCMTMAETAVNSLDEAADYLREQMEDRVSEVTISVANYVFVDKQQISEDWKTILYGAFEHTGVSTQGDYIMRHYGQSKGSISVKGSTATFKYTITYDTTLEQENIVGDKIDELFKAWDELYDFYTLSDYEQIEIIYDYICANVVYDYTNLNDPSYTLKYSAYAALINGTAVCQGYANLFYRMALEADIDNRIIVGDAGGAHAWNIVELKENYYYLDSTWDAGRYDYGYKYFLVGSDSFHTDHTPDAEFWTEEFLEEYPIQAKDYDCDIELLMDALLSGLWSYFDTVKMDQALTRLDMAKLIASVAKLELDPNVALPYEDCAELTDQEKQIIAAVEKFGVMQARNDGTFRPFDTVSRAHVAQMLYRTMHDNVDAEDLGDYADDGYFTDVESFTWYAPYINYLASIGVIPAWGSKTFNPNAAADFRTALRWAVRAANYEGPGDPSEIIASGTCGDEYIGTSLTWTLTGEGTLTISGEGEMGNFELDTVPWKEYISKITSVVIEEGVTKVGGYAFFGCKNLERVTFPSSLTIIESQSFTYCESLTEIVIPANVNFINFRVFTHCAALTSITVDSSNEFYCSEDGVLFSKEKDILVTYPAGKTQTEYKIPNSVENVDDFAFEGSKNLKSIVIPESVTHIDWGAFADCTLETVYYTGTKEQWDKVKIGQANEPLLSANLVCQGVAPEKPEIPEDAVASGECSDDVIWYLTEDGTLTIAGKGEISYFRVNSDPVVPWYTYGIPVTSIVIKEGVTGIGYSAFDNCTASSVTIADSVTYIRSSAFQQCEALTSVELGDHVTDIGDFAFDKCVSLTSVKIGNGVTSIASHAFSGCSSLTNVEIGNSVTSIESSAFANCISLTGIRLPDSLTKIGGFVFSGCTALTDIEIPDGVTSLGSSVFSFCTSLTEMDISDNVTSMGACLFSGCAALERVTIGSSITAIGDSTFRDCASLTVIVLPESCTTVGEFAFSGCTALKTADLGGTETIEMYAFEKCKALESVTLSENLTRVDSYVFSGCTSLVTACFGGDFFQWNAIRFSNGNVFLRNADIVFGKSVSDADLEEILASGECGENLTWVLTRGGVLTVSGEGEMDGYPSWSDYGTSIVSIIIEDGATSIGVFAFDDCVSLKSVSIPASVEELNWYGFSGCELLREIVVDSENQSYSSEDGVLFTKDGSVLIAYPAGKRQADYVIPDGVTTVSMSAFNQNPYLHSVVVPFSVTEIQINAFYMCTNLATIYYAGTQDQWTDVAGDNYPEEVEIIYGWTDDPAVLLGDVNGDGKVNGTDTNLIFRYVSGMAEFTEEQLKAADVNGDGKVNGTDTNLVFRFVSGAIDSLG